MNNINKARQDYFHLRISPQERKIIETLAVREGRSLSDLVREAIREYALKRSVYSVGLFDLLFKYDENVEVDTYAQQ